MFTTNMIKFMDKKIMCHRTALEPQKMEGLSVNHEQGLIYIVFLHGYSLQTELRGRGHYIYPTSSSCRMFGMRLSGFGLQ